MNQRYEIAVIAGDGIGQEVVPEGMRVLETAANKFDFNLSWQEFDWSCKRFLEKGSMMPADGIQQLSSFDSIFLGAVGFPGVPDHVSLWGLLIPIRRNFDQYINLRPIQGLPNIPLPLKQFLYSDIDLVIVRENTEGEYSDIGSRVARHQEDEFAMQTSVFTRKGVDRVMHYAFNLAKKRTHKLASATKSNGILHTMPFWDERAREVGSSYKEVELSEHHIDILSARFISQPDQFDVVVASNLFGDILSDLGAALVGTIAIAPSANINPERNHPSMFEPVHGSAPDIFGKNTANPIGQIWSGAMMLEHLGETEAAAAIMAAINDELVKGRNLTPDMGGSSKTFELGAAIASRLQ